MVNVPTSEEHQALDNRVTMQTEEIRALTDLVTANSEAIRALDARVAALEGGTTPEPPEPPDEGYTDSGPIVATAGQTIKKVRIKGAPGTAITVKGVADVHIEDVIIEETGGHCVFIQNAQRVRVVNSTLRPKRTKTALDTQHAVCVRDSTAILVQGNIMKDYESGVHVVGGHSVTVRGNYGEGPKGPFPRGQHVQMYPVNQDGPTGQGGVIDWNYFVCKETTEPINDRVGVEDGINVGSRSMYARVTDNYLVGGRAESGCGIILEGGCDSGLVARNTVIRTSQVGVNIVASAYCVVEENKALDTNLSADSTTLGNLGLGAWYHSGDTRCHDNQIRKNIVSNKLVNGTYNDVWLKGGCGTQADNTKGDAARALLTPEAEKLPPPPIPPKPWTAGT